jgi:phosphoribosyl-ATP pyrophosphohydrolase
MAKDTSKNAAREDARIERRRRQGLRLIKGIGKKRSSLPVANPDAASPHILDEIAEIVQRGAGEDPTSHSARLLARGRPSVAQKFGEESIELVIALLGNDKPDIIGESADVLYHLLVAWQAAGIRPEEVWAELQRRKDLSALVEIGREVDKNTLRLALGTSKLPV